MNRRDRNKQRNNHESKHASRTQTCHPPPRRVGSPIASRSELGQRNLVERPGARNKAAGSIATERITKEPPLPYPPAVAFHFRSCLSV